MSDDMAAGLSAIVGDVARVITAPAVVERLSKDFYWYSPVLKKQLQSKKADIVVQPVSVDEVLAIARYAGERDIPLTVRGAGTGNYGQCIPLQGGIVMDLALMDKLEAITPDGVAVCQPGLRLAVLETEANKIGWELRMYPSTLAKASVGGFLAGGSGGIGSVAHGGLRDFDTVRAFEVVTMEREPRVVLHEGAAVHEILHAWGTNGILTRIWFALTPAVKWVQCTAAFDTFDEGFLFAKEIAEGNAWKKRLVTVFEWPIPSFFTPVKQVVAQDKTLVLIMIAASQVELLHAAVSGAKGTVTFTGAYVGC
jgi:FAD/FMN-containing dehydrogenase